MIPRWTRDGCRKFFFIVQGRLTSLVEHDKDVASTADAVGGLVIVMYC